MTVRTEQQLLSADTTKSVEIADRIHWVGHQLEGDPFQCHAYLIEHGDQSVLIDPGSNLTFGQTLDKVKRLIPLEHLRYIIVHHQDPDITCSLPQLDTLISRPDARVVTHARCRDLVKHYGLKLPFWLVDEHDWKLDLGGRELRFVFTPYMHFPGAFCTFVPDEGVLFSSDIFGGYTEPWSLIATDIDVHFEAIRPFHEHYIPSREAMHNGLAQVEQLELELIAPQHGSLIPKWMIGPLTSRLKDIDCGLYLIADQDTNVHRLSRINQLMRGVLQAMVLYREFNEVAAALLEFTQELVPATALEFYADWQQDDVVMHMGPHSRYQADRVPAPAICTELMRLSADALRTRYGTLLIQRNLATVSGSTHAMIIPLFEPATQKVNALAVIRLPGEVAVTTQLAELLTQLTMPLEVALERERVQRALEIERQDVYERSIRDPLTGLYTRLFMHETVRRMMDQHDRDPEAAIAVLMFDIDRFKLVNDTFGHAAGDEVLRRVAGVLRTTLRGTDIAVRLGGEEFAVFFSGRSAAYANSVAERVRRDVSELRFDGAMTDHTLTISAGACVRRPTETLEGLLKRADEALYMAKRAGRNQVVTQEYAELDHSS